MSAIISSDGVYRYRLERDIVENAGQDYLPMSVIMVNPSTASAVVNDPTINRLLGFSRSLGVTRLIVGNLFALRATDIHELAYAADPVGPDNDLHLGDILRDSRGGRVIAAWGTTGKIPIVQRSRVDDVVRMTKAAGLSLWCWATNKDGSPKHPLYLPGNAVLRPYEHTPVGV